MLFLLSLGGSFSMVLEATLVSFEEATICFSGGFLSQKGERIRKTYVADGRRFGGRNFLRNFISAHILDFG